ncbi:hypothetical protein [Morganella morganii]|uniref:hypothetical protein n=1 Tax=Morganella morganii TaxID=582 RepID=UPI000BBD3979|nr:hypothetical protein [Morganella morganii]ATF52644.1 hypothetical protein CO693_02480 [Morganella morganii]
MTNGKLEIVNPFNPPYEVWQTREPTSDEISSHAKIHGNIFAPDVKVKLITTIKNHHEAAIYQLTKAVTNIEDHIDNYLDNDVNFSNLLSKMPSTTPSALSDYQEAYDPGLAYEEVSSIIKDVGVLLPDGQYVFHGGVLPRVNGQLKTTRPLSTSLCPQVALREAEFCGKPINSKKLELVVLKVTKPKTKAYVYKTKGTEKGHEKEILFASGADITMKGCIAIDRQYTFTKPDYTNITVPAFVIVGEIS